MSKPAVTNAPLHPLLAERWSPRAFDADHHLADDHVTTLVEAARWAPSSMNSQPWRFLVGRRGDEAHGTLVEVLGDSNRTWAVRASALVLVAAASIDAKGRNLAHARYDTGGAVAHLVAQATALDLVVHQMGGFDAEAARSVLDLDPSVDPLVVLAVGRHDPAAVLPDELAAREVAARVRKPLDELVLALPARLRRTA